MWSNSHLDSPGDLKGSRIVARRTAVSLFSGCGGLCEGMDLAGFDVKAAVEMDRFAAETYRYNFPKVPLLEGDVHTFLKPHAKDHLAKYKLYDVDVIFGGPPCQGYSQIGTRDLEDSRNELYAEYARVVQTLRPRLFLMENVPNLLLLNKGYYRDKIIRKFRSIGYPTVAILKVSAADYGVPQLRQRVLFVGTRDISVDPDELRGWCCCARKSEARAPVHG